MTNPDEPERLRRWRLLIGGSDDDPLGSAGVLSFDDQRIDGALAAVYDSRGPGEPGSQLSAGLGSSAPRVVGWLGDIRTYFPSTVVQVMQRDAIERMDLPNAGAICARTPERMPSPPTSRSARSTRPSAKWTRTSLPSCSAWVNVWPRW